MYAEKDFMKAMDKKRLPIPVDETRKLPDETPGYDDFDLTKADLDRLAHSLEQTDHLEFPVWPAAIPEAGVGIIRACPEKVSCSRHAAQGINEHIDKVVYDAWNDTIGDIMSEIMKHDEAVIMDILHHHIDNPIVGEITPEKIKAAGIRRIAYNEDPYDILDIKVTAAGVTVSGTSALLGVIQGDWLIGPGGMRRPLTEKEQDGLARMEREESVKYYRKEDD